MATTVNTPASFRGERFRHQIRSARTFVRQFSRKPAGVVDMGVTQHDAIDPPGIERQPRVQRVGLRPAALKQACVEQDSGSGRFEQVHRAGDLAGGAPECDSGGAHEGCGLSAMGCDRDHSTPGRAARARGMAHSS